MRKLKLDELDRLSIQSFRESEKNPIIVVLDNIRSAHNVGSVFRTCDAMAVDKLILCGITARPPHKEIHKSAIGATESVEWEYHKNVHEVIKSFKSDGHMIIGIEQTTDSKDLMTFEFAVEKGRKIVAVFGNEVEGISNELLDLLDHAIEIPQYGTKHSLNVSVCAGIVIYDLVRRLKL